MRRAISLLIAASALFRPLSVGWCASALPVPNKAPIAAAATHAVTGDAIRRTRANGSGWRIGQSAQLRPMTGSESRPDAARSYLNARSSHYFLGNLYELLLLFALLTVGIGVRYWTWFGRICARPWVRALLFVPAVLCTIAILSFPLDAWNHALALDFDHSRARWPVWIASWARSRSVDVVVVSVVFLVLYPIIRRSARTWWLAAWVALLVVTGIGGISRVITLSRVAKRMEPISWRYPDVVADMERVARNAGESIPPSHLVEMTVPGSLRRDGIEPEFAAASPMGVPERILFAEPLINRTNRPEILFVFAHEMGHLALHHSVKRTVIDALILLALVFAGFRAATWMVTRWGSQWGIANTADHASLPLLVFLLAMVNFLMIPAFNLTSRHFEHEADRYGLEAIHGIVPSPAAAAAGLFQLCLENCGADADLGGLAGFWFRDHPTDDERTQFAISYNPWSEGRHPRYVVPRITDADSSGKQIPTASP